ncbi:Tight junction protein ZO-1 [Cichlidogyrus casuarinus]|uniref:Tight junction protein ZO-1 n=1 Tax=Cichlidogyrus casuarinus TaxID=1844966 RepID=A0ABD2QH67_9PLAT
MEDARPQDLDVCLEEAISHEQDPVPIFVDLQMSRDTNGESLGMELTSRLVVKNVTQDSYAQEAGLKPGDRLVAINGVEVSQLSLLEAAQLLKCQNCMVKVARNGTRETGIYQKGIRKGSRRNHFFGVDFRDGKSSRRSVRYRTSSEPTIAANAWGSQTLGLNELSPTFSSLPREQTIQRCNQRSEDGLNALNKSLQELEFATNKHRRESIQTTHAYANTKFKSKFRVSLTKCSRLGSGLKIFGGNTVGIFIADVHPESAAHHCGVKAGDEIIKINGQNTKGCTKEEAALLLMKSGPTIEMELERDIVKYKEARGQRDLDSFFVRTFFNFDPKMSAPILMPRGSRFAEQFLVKKCQVFHVVDTFYQNELGFWKAIRVHPLDQRTYGLLPNVARAEEYVSNAHNQDVTTNFVSRSTYLNQETVGTIYEKVLLLPSYPRPRPVVIYGPLSDLVRHSLAFPNLSYLKRLTDIELKFELPPCSFLDDASPGLIRLSVIRVILTLAMPARAFE